jgi:hypothetical protein
MSGEIPLVDDGTPPRETGVYVAYVNHMHITTHAGREMLFYDAQAKRWGYLGSDQWYRGHVYGWIGPLPTMKFDLSKEGKIKG